MARRILPGFSGGPQNDGEARVINYLTENLPPESVIDNLKDMGAFGPEYIIIANLEIPDRSSFLEIDAIVVTPHAVYLVEVKDWFGKISGNDTTWFLNDRKEVDNPLKTLNYKCRVLKSIVTNKIPDLRKVRFQGIVVIAKKDTILQLNGECSSNIFLLDEILIKYLKNPPLVHRDMTRNSLVNYQEEITRVIANRSREKQQSKVIQGYNIIEELNSGEDYIEYLGKPIYGHSQGGLKKLRVFTLPVFMEKKNKDACLQKILRDYDALNSIGSHTNIVAARGVVEHESAYLVEIIDWSEQGTLRGLLSKVKLNFDQIISIIKGIAFGLEAIHRKGIIHRDLKPENILMDNLCPKIMNFDHAYIEEDGFQTVWKTVSQNKDKKYLPFELILPKAEYDFYESSDIYSLGAIFYEMLCQNLPYQGPEGLDANDGILPLNLLPSKINDEIPAWVDEVISKMYTTNIDLRYKDVVSFMNDLDNKLNTLSSNLIVQTSTQNIKEELELDPDRLFKENERVGDYRILEHIKGGGFSNVYKALHVFQNIEYALKVYNLNVPLTSLIDEFWLLNQLNHPNIVKVNWSGELIPGRFYIAMEYLKGLSLNSYIWGNKKLTVEQVISVAEHIVKALRYLHEKNTKPGPLANKSLYHRDIKPGNIVYVEGRGFVLIDFNISKEADESVTFAGTGPYIAPDLVEGSKILWNESGDTFALGITLYELFCKKHPYPNNEPRISYQPIHPNQTDEGKNLSIEICNFLLKAIQPRYNERFKTAEEMEKALLSINNPDLFTDNSANNKPVSHEFLNQNGEFTKNPEEKIITNEESKNQLNNTYQVIESLEDNVSKTELLKEFDQNTICTFSWVPLSEDVEFKISSNNREVPAIIWSKMAKEEIYPKYLLISELLDNGKAIQKDSSVIISYEEISQLNNVDQALLELPSFYPYIIKIDAEGTLNESEFNYKWGFYEHSIGKQFFAKRIGNIITFDDISYSLSENQFNLCNALEKFNSIPLTEKSSYKNFLAFAEIKELAIKAGAILDSYLQNENVITPKTIDLNIINNSDDTIDLVPEVDVDDKEQFGKRFNKNPRVQNTYNLENSDGERTRIIFSPPYEEELKKVKSLRKIKGEERDKLIENPQELFDPDIIDLDKFSERVKAIGLYKPKFYPFITPYKSEWIPGFLIELTPENRKKVEFQNKQELQSFKDACEISIKENKSNVEWKDLTIPVYESEPIIKAAEMQFLDQSKPINTEKINNKKVLIIKDNIEDIEHSTDINSSERSKSESFIHRFGKVPNLKDDVNILEHQKEGIAWLQSMYTDGYYGALLADDMGLGKTLQLLSFVQWHNRNKNQEGKPYLIIAPVSLLENWEAEYEKFFEESELNFTKAYGNSLSKVENSSKWELSIQSLQKRHIVLTTYETMRKKQFTLCAVDWSVAILDEAQKVKTPGTLITNAVKALKSDFKIAATGTPVENTLVDLWCIMDFVMPGLLGSAKDFSKEFQNPLKQGDTDLNKLGENLRQKIGISLKRRMKKDILTGLPNKNILPLEKLMPELQLKVYESEIMKTKEMEFVGTDRTNSVLRMIQMIRDISDHPYLIGKQVDSFTSDELINTSAKLQQTIDILNDVREKNEKVIIFADKRETQRLLARVIFDKYGISPSIINGDTPSSAQKATSSNESRQQAVNRFQNKEGFNVIVMSPLSAGVGLNITKANHVIHYSRHWNPAKEDQATDRVYRIGQEKDVYIYLPMATSENFKTFDVILDELLVKKRSLANASLFPTERAEVSTEDLLQDMFAAFAGSR